MTLNDHVHLGGTGTAVHNRYKVGAPPTPTLHLATKRSIRGRTRKPLPTADYLVADNGVETPLTLHTENNQ